MRRGIGYVAQAGGVLRRYERAREFGAWRLSLGSSRAVTGAIERVYAQFSAVPRPRRAAAPAACPAASSAPSPSPARLVVEPRLIILDEPSAALAPRFIDEIYATLADLNRSGSRF